MILPIEHVNDLNDIAIRYVNVLLERHAMDQRMLQDQKPPNQRLVEQMEEVRDKNSKLEAENREVRALLAAAERREAALSSMNTALELKCIQLNTCLTEQVNRDALTFGNSYADRREDDAAHKTTLRPHSIDGAAAIQEGKEALEKFVAKARRPDRGE